MKISYAIPVCNELVEIQRLIGFLLENKRKEDEIVILFDSTNGTSEVETFLRHYTKDNLIGSFGTNMLLMDILLI